MNPFESWLNAAEQIIIMMIEFAGWAFRRPPMQQVRAWVTGPGYQYWLGLGRVLIWAFPIWLVAAFVLYWANVLVFHSPDAFSWLAGITAFVWIVVAIWGAPIALLVSVVLSVRQIRRVRTFAADMFDGTHRNWSRYFHAVGWALVGELVFFTYHRIFPVWKNLAALPLLIMASALALILSFQVKYAEGRKIETEKLRPIIMTCACVIVALCTLSFIIPGPFHILAGKLNALNMALSQGRWLPVAALIILLVAALAAGKKFHHLHIPLVALTILYVGFVGIETAVLKYNLPRTSAQFVGGVGLILTVAGVGLMLPKGDGAWLRAWKGMALIAVVIVPLLGLYFSNTQAKRIYESTTTAVSADSTRRATPDQPLPRYKVCANLECPECLRGVSGEKTRMAFCDRCSAKLVWVDQLSDSLRTEFMLSPQGRDLAKLSLGGSSDWATTRRQSMDLNEYLKGGK